MRFSIQQINREDKVIETISVIGRQMPSRVADDSLYFYVKSPNKFGVKWVIIDKKDTTRRDVSVVNDSLFYKERYKIIIND